MRLTVCATLGVAMVVASVSGASAFSTDRAAWLNYLQEQRRAQRQQTPTTASLHGGMEAETGRVMPRGVLPAKPVPHLTSPAPSGAAAAPRTATRASLQIDPKFLPADVSYSGGYAPGTIVIDTEEKYLYHVGPGGTARRYGVGVGRPGFQWSGTHRVSMKREWPGWTPPEQMRKRQPDLPAYMEGGPNNPLGARAMYLGSTLYRIHGSNAPWTIGHEVSSGCIRMRNEDVIELYQNVDVGTKVVVLR